MKLIKKLNITSALFIVLCSFGLSTLLSRDINNSLFGSIERNEGFFSFCYLFVFYLALISLKNPKYWKRLFVIIAVLGVIMSLLVIYQFGCGVEQEVGGVFPTKCNWDSEGTRPEGTVGNPAFLSGWLLLTFSFTCLAIAQKKRLLLLLSGGLLQILAIYAAGIRGAYIGLVAWFVIFLVLRKWDK